MTSSVVEEATTSSADDNKACSDERCRKDKHSGSKGIKIGDGNS